MGKKDEKAKVVATSGKGNRHAKRKSMYAAQFSVTETNKKKKLARHLRRYPDDINANRIFGERYSR